MPSSVRRGGGLRQLVKFNLVGAVNTLADLAAFALLVRLGAEMLSAQCAAYGCGMLVSYLLNKSWTFQDKGGADVAQIAKFLAVNLFVLALSAALMHRCMETWGLTAWQAKLLVTAATAWMSFAGCRLWVFGRETGKEGKRPAAAPSDAGVSPVRTSGNKD